MTPFLDLGLSRHRPWFMSAALGLPLYSFKASINLSVEKVTQRHPSATDAGLRSLPTPRLREK